MIAELVADELATANRRPSSVRVSTSAMRCLSSMTCSVSRSSTMSPVVLVLAVDLEATQIDALFLARGRLFGAAWRSVTLRTRWPRRVVDVVGRLRRSVVHHLPRGRAATDP